MEIPPEALPLMAQLDMETASASDWRKRALIGSMALGVLKMEGIITEEQWELAIGIAEEMCEKAGMIP